VSCASQRGSKLLLPVCVVEGN